MLRSSAEYKWVQNNDHSVENNREMKSTLMDEDDHSIVGKGKVLKFDESLECPNNWIVSWGHQVEIVEEII